MKQLKKWKVKRAKKRAKNLASCRDSDTDEELCIIEEPGEEKTMAIKQEKKAKHASMKDYKFEEDSLNQEETSNVLEVLEKREPTAEEASTLKNHAVFKEMLRGVLAEELKPIKESVGTLTNLYSQLSNHLLYKREKTKTSKQFKMYSDKTETSTSPSLESATAGAADTNTPPPRLFDQLPGPSTSGRTNLIKLEEQDNQSNTCMQRATPSAGAVDSEGDLEYVGDSSLGVKAHKDLISKALDSSTERKKLALNMMEVVFSSSELRESTISGSNNKKKLDSLRVAAIKGFIFKHYPPQDEADRSSSWGRIKEAITDKCRKFRPDKKTYLDDFKH